MTRSAVASCTNDTPRRIGESWVVGGAGLLREDGEHARDAPPQRAVASDAVRLAVLTFGTRTTGTP